MGRLSPSNSQFDSFLYAPLYETGETSLSVLSALARQDIDPWREAARLDQLPKEAAINSFASTIWKSDSERWSPTDASIIAASLIERLPSPRGSPVSSISIESANGKFMMWLVYGILLGSIAASSNMQSDSNQPNHANRAVVRQQAAQSIPGARTD
jgi:hypothetical protein